jgi:putative toxin-antitoxin system antitoxin component (TIGR02293 family)
MAWSVMTAIARIQELLGGEEITGPMRDELDVVRLVRRGVPTRAVDRFLERSNLSFNVIEGHVLPRRTFNRRRDAKQALDAGESDRLLRLVRIVALAQETFGDRAKATVWLNRQNRALGGQTPLSLTDTDLGSRSVEVLLGRIGHGIAA